MVKYNTSLNIADDWRKEVLSGTVRSDTSNIYQESNGVKNAGLDHHGDHGFVQSAICAWSQDISNVPAVSDESRCNHERKKDVKRKGNRQVCRIQIFYSQTEFIRNIFYWCGLVVGDHDAQRCISDISRQFPCCHPMC